MKNKKILIITIGIVVLVGLSILAIVLLIKDKNKTNIDVNVIYLDEIPISKNTIEVVVEGEYSYDVTSAKVLEIREEDKKGLVDSIIEERNLNMDLLVEERNVGYTWCNEDQSRCMIYDIYPETLSFGFMDNPTNLSYDVSNLADPQEVWEIFQEDFLLGDWEYTNFNLERDDDGFMVTAKRSVDGIPFDRVADIQYTDHIKFNSKGFLISGKILLVDYDNSFSVDLLDSNLLEKVINSDQYPKQYVVDKSKLNLNVEEQTGDIDLSYPEELNQIESCNANNIELVYVWKNRGVSQYITPVYKVDCLAEVFFNDQINNVPIFLYTNAITTDSILVE